MNKLDLGKNIKRLRRAAGLSQVALAEACGWGPDNARISHYEVGRREPSIEDLSKIAKAVRAHVADFYQTPIKPVEGGDTSAADVQKLVNAFMSAPEDRQKFVLDILNVRKGV